MELRKVACVDDDPFVGMMVEAALETSAMHVVRFTSGMRAVEGLKYTQPQMVLLDFMMPDLDGIQVLRELRGHAATADIPVVFLTGKAEPHDIDFYLEHGVVQVIPKPFDPCMLPERVAQIWRQIRRGRLH